VEEEDIDFVKMLYVTSSLLLDSPYVRLLQALVTDKVSGEDIVYYWQLVPSDNRDDFQLLDNGRIDRSFYEARKARLLQTILNISDNIYSEIIRIANEESLNHKELWRNYNFISLKTFYSRGWNNIFESELERKDKLIDEGVNLSLLYVKSKKLFDYDIGGGKKNNSYNLFAEALFWLSSVGMFELCFYLVCMLKKSQSEKTYVDVEYPNHEDLLLNPTAMNLKRYLASVDLSRGSMQTLNQIKKVDDFWFHLYDVFYPFSLLISKYELHLTSTLSARSKSFFERLGLPVDASGKSWVNLNTEHDKTNEDNGNEYEQSEGNDNTSGIIDDYYTTTGNSKSSYKRDAPNILEFMRESVVKESQYSLKSFPLVNALKNYKLRGGPINLIGYINKIAKNELTNKATKKDGVFTTAVYYKEKFDRTKRTVQRAKKILRDRKGLDEEKQNIKDIEVLEVINENTLKRNHRCEAHLSQNELVSLITKVLNEQGIKCSDTTTRNVLKDLREKNVIVAMNKDRSYFFKKETENLKNIYLLIKNIITEKKLLRKNLKKKEIASPE